MKKLILSLTIVLVLLALLPSGLVFAQKSLPQVPITYPGDTDETIMRRAKWIEGAKKEGLLVWWGTTRPDQAAGVIAEFNKIYPFIKVDYWRGSDSELGTKLETGFVSGRLDADVVAGGGPENYPRWRKMGRLEKFTDIVPRIEKIHKGLYSRYGDSFVPGSNVTAPQYNTKLISAAEAPKTWEDLLDPKWKGQTGMSTALRVFTVLAMAEGGWGIEKTEGFIRKLKKQEIIWQRGHTAGQALMISGEFKILVDGQMHHVIRAQDKGTPVGWVRVNPMTVTGASFILPKKAPHPNVARLFLEWQLSPQGLVAYEKSTYFGAVYPGAQTRVGKFVEGLNFVYRTEEVIQKIIELDLDKKFSEILGVTPGEGEG